MDQFLPYGKQLIDDDDIAAVVAVLKSDWLTTGPLGAAFEEAVARFVGVEHAIALANGTAALHAIMATLDIGAGDEVIVPAMTFVATSNAVLYQGATPVFADSDSETLLLSPESVSEKITSRTKAVIAVDYAGQPCDYDRLQALLEEHNIPLIADACHSLGAALGNRMCGSLAEMSAFSFHPVKPLTTGEGGMVTTNNPAYAEKLRRFRNHGISTDHSQRQAKQTWYYEMVELGYNYRMTDLQSALGLSQLQKLPAMIEVRQQLAREYDRRLDCLSGVSGLKTLVNVQHGHHLYVLRVLNGKRNQLFARMREAGIGVHVHYIPVYLHPYYQKHLALGKGLCPVAEHAYSEIMTLPLHAAMTVEDIERVCANLERSLGQV